MSNNKLINKKILNILFNNKDKTINKKYIIKNDNTIVNKSSFAKIEKNK